jgi:hypothetical protein
MRYCISRNQLKSALVKGKNSRLAMCRAGLKSDLNIRHSQAKKNNPQGLTNRTVVIMRVIFLFSATVFAVYRLPLFEQVKQFGISKDLKISQSNIGFWICFFTGNNGSFRNNLNANRFQAE